MSASLGVPMEEEMNAAARGLSGSDVNDGCTGSGSGDGVIAAGGDSEYAAEDDYISRSQGEGGGGGGGLSLAIPQLPPPANATATAASSVPPIAPSSSNNLPSTGWTVAGGSAGAGANIHPTPSSSSLSGGGNAMNPACSPRISDLSGRVLKRRRRDYAPSMGEEPTKQITSHVQLESVEKDAYFRRIWDLFDTQQLCDVTFSVSGQLFKAHKLVLTGHHNFFSAILTTAMAEGSQEVITLKDTDAKLFKFMLDYMYGKQVSVHSSDVLQLLGLASRYQLEGLKDQLSATLAANLDPENAVGVFAAADCFNCTKLKEQALAKITSNFAIASTTEAFASLEEHQLHELLQSDHILDCDESVVFEAAVRWLKADPEREKNRAADVFSVVRFPLMDAGLLTDWIKVHPLMKNPTCTHLLLEAYEHQALMAAGRQGLSDSPRIHPRRRSCSFRKHTLLMEHQDAVSALEVVHGKLVSGSWDTTIKVWNPDNWLCERTLSDHTGTIRCFTVCAGRLISGSDDYSIRVWNTDSWTLVRALTDHSDVVNAVIECNGRLVSGSDDGTIKLFNTSTWQCEVTIHQEDHACGVLALATVGNHLVSGSDEAVIKVWDTQNWTCLKAMTDHTDEIWALKMVGDKLVSGSIDSKLRVWNTVSWTCDEVLSEHTGAVYAMTVLEDKLVTASSDETIKVWNRELSGCERTLQCQGVWALAVHNDRLVSGSYDNAIKVWV